MGRLQRALEIAVTAHRGRGARTAIIATVERLPHRDGEDDSSDVDRVSGST